MLILVTIGLLIAAAILLILAVILHAVSVLHTLALTYTSIGLAVLAVVTMTVHSAGQRRRSQRRAAKVLAAATSGRSVAADGVVSAEVAAPDPAPTTLAVAADAPSPVAGPDAGVPAPEPRAVVAEPLVPDAAAVDSAESATAVVDADADLDVGDWDDDEVVFPIEDYDDLQVAEILPLLPELDSVELEAVREREAGAKARGTVLRRIAALAAGDSPGMALPTLEPEPETALEPEPEAAPPPAVVRSQPVQVRAGRRQRGGGPYQRCPGQASHL